MKRCAMILVLGMTLWCAGLQAAYEGTDAAADRVMAAAGAHRLIVIGEMHGTREIPALVSELARRYARQGPLRVALEVSRDEQADLNAYLNSSGGRARRTALSRRPYWNVDLASSDGLRTEDALDLIESLRQLRAQGRDVAVVAFDLATQARPQTDARDGKTRARDRDRSMAQYLRAAHADLPRGRILVLTGNVHAMLRAPNARFQAPMAGHLLDLAPYTVNVAAREGAFWACQAGKACGPVPIKTTTDSGPLALDDTHHYLLVLPRFTPARLVGAPLR